MLNLLVSISCIISYMPESYKTYIKRMKSASSLEELQQILGEAIHDKSVFPHQQFAEILEAMDQREKKLGLSPDES